MRLTTKLLVLVTLLVALPLTGQTQPAAGPKAVLVTGASTGIGRKITERLAGHGYFVYAGARKDTDLQALAAIKNVQPVRLDVTSPRDIEAAVATITTAGRGLYGLVNNAGVVTIGSVLDTKMEEFDVVMAVNVYGPWRITRAFAPLIIAAKGRIANIGSVNGIISPAQTSAYSMSKHAIEGFSDALAQEMAPLGVQVSVVEPGGYKSEIFKNEVQRSGTGAQIAAIASHGKEPDEVAAAVEQALFDSRPKRRYLVVPNTQQADMTIQAQIQQLVQLNETQPYTYDRAALVKMLDEALAQVRAKTPYSATSGVVK
jgi:NAD(P)-dependent dehydrogenase (short-subunit alcohol dehydrogenase family)